MRRRWPALSLVPATAIVAVGPGPAHAVQYLTVEQAQRLCFAEATAFEPADVKLTREQMRAIEKDSRVDVREATEKVWRALKGTTFLGWFIEDEVVGKHEFITWALALNTDGSVRQIEILDYRETYGHEIRDPKWREQFVGKTHGAPLKLDADIKNISGATLSSRHIAEGVRRLLSFHALVLTRCRQALPAAPRHLLRDLCDPHEHSGGASRHRRRVRRGRAGRSPYELPRPRK